MTLLCTAATNTVRKIKRIMNLINIDIHTQYIIKLQITCFSNAFIIL